MDGRRMVGHRVSRLGSLQDARRTAPTFSRQFSTSSNCGSRTEPGDISQKVPVTFDYEETMSKLNQYYLEVKKQILRYQSPTTGLFPCDVQPERADEAHIRDSIYCAACLWALSQAFKRIDDDKGKTYELSQSAVKCMRGILACWLKQADKVERFKQHQSPINALHSKFHMATGDPILSHEQYNHLQIDCVALYLIFLVQMIQSGLQIIYTLDEVNFIQNLVFYVERAYRTPDYGMWERGSKYNNGSNELHASSVGMAQAALECVSGVNLFGDQGASWSVIFVDVDSYHRNETTFQTLLPRESPSKNTDASLLATIGWPAFALHEEQLICRTRDKIVRKLKGKYGFKRFLRDGYRTEVEDRNRRYYKPAEIKMFDGIECEWPLFYIYMLIDSVFRGDQEQLSYWQNELQPLLKYTNDGAFVPKYYYVPEDSIEDERVSPGSQDRFPSDEGYEGLVFLWGQSVYIISQLLVDGLLHINELDPIRRYLPAADRPRPNSRYSSFQRAGHDDITMIKGKSSPSDLVVQVVLIAESVRLQQMLATYGIQTQTPHQIEPIEIWPPSELSKAYEQLGINKKLELTGRPPRPFGGLGTAKIYRASGYMFLCYPLLFEVSDFYLSQDMQFVLDDVKSDLTFLAKCWKLAGRPTFCMIIREDNMRGPNARHIFASEPSFVQVEQNITQGGLQGAGNMEFSHVINTPEVNATLPSSSESSSLQEDPNSIKEAASYTGIDFKSKLQQYTAKHSFPNPFYDPQLDQENPQKGWTCKIIANGKNFQSEGTFVTRIRAEQSAAQEAYTFFLGESITLAPSGEFGNFAKNVGTTMETDGPDEDEKSLSRSGEEKKAPQVPESKTNPMETDAPSENVVSSVQHAPDQLQPESSASCHSSQSAINERTVSHIFDLPPSPIETTIRLHDYQEELAQEARDGNNVIICSPTGSGKTIIAAFIARDLRRRRLETKDKFKALFLVCTRHLVTQQRDAFRLVFTGPDKHVVEALLPEESLEDMLERHEILMLTAQILVNSLQRYEIGGRGLRISDCDLLILDECHHTYYNHPYNTIMRLYQKSKREGNTKLPQIIGLSASLGVGPDDDPRDHYVTICANLDCTQIEHVRNENNLKSLLEHNPRPTVDQIRIVPQRKEDKFISDIKKVMRNFHEKYTQGSLGITQAFGSQGYQQQVVASIKATKEDTPLNRVQRIALEKLEKLNDSLMMYEDLQYEQVKVYLERHFDQKDLPSEPLPEHKAILEEVTLALKNIDAQRNQVFDNPKISKLVELLQKLSSDLESKGILLTKTRVVNKGLISLIEEHPVLSNQIRVGRLVGKRAGDQLQMTDNEQNEVCKKFQKDCKDPESVNLLVATDVAQEGLDIPKCNYVIRYDFVSDEIGSVQSRGRARAKNSECYLIVTEGSINAQRERENLLREHVMLETLKQIDNETLTPLIIQKQEELWNQYQNDLKNKSEKRKTSANSIEFLCSGCHAFLCRGSDITMKGTHYLCDAQDFLDRVDVYFKDKFKEGVKTHHRFDDLIGGMVCKVPSCQQKIGIVNKYKNDPYQRKYGYNIICKSVLVKENKNGKDIIYSMKKWSNAPFQPQKEPLGH